jgi:hypothetical protein
MTSHGPDLQAFVIRVRREPREIPGAPAEWTFWIEHHPSGTHHYYRDFAGVLTFIAEYLPPEAIERRTRPAGE